MKQNKGEMNMNMQALMAQAQRMQRDITKKKEELNKMEFEGKSQLVTVKVNGKRELLQVLIDPSVSLASDDLEMLQDMIVLAVNDAMKQVDVATESIMGQYGSALNGLF